MRKYSQIIFKLLNPIFRVPMCSEYISDKKYYLTFYEVERKTQTVNVIPMIVDAALEEKGYGSGSILEGEYFSRTGNWYIALTVTDKDLKDNLKEDEPALKTFG